MQEIIIIAAMAENRVIGKDNALPWSLKEDMARFRELTKGWPCVMGRKTWESLPKKPLPGRLNIVVSGTMTDSSVPKDELCPQEQALSPRTSSVPKDEFCPQEQALSLRTGSALNDELCPQEQALSLQRQASSPRTSSVPKDELCPQKLSSQDSTQNGLVRQPGWLPLKSCIFRAKAPKKCCFYKEVVQKLKFPNNSNVKFFSSLPAAIEHCTGYEKVFICGGEAIYRQALSFANKIELTIIHKHYEGDAFFPEIDAAIWKKINTINFDTFSFITYTKHDNPIKEMT